jgi:hypothetical protein
MGCSPKSWLSLLAVALSKQCPEPATWCAAGEAVRYAVLAVGFSCLQAGMLLHLGAAASAACPHHVASSLYSVVLVCLATVGACYFREALCLYMWQYSGRVLSLVGPT